MALLCVNRTPKYFGKALLSSLIIKELHTFNAHCAEGILTVLYNKQYYTPKLNTNVVTKRCPYCLVKKAKQDKNWQSQVLGRPIISELDYPFAVIGIDFIHCAWNV